MARVLDACALRADIEMLSDGDKTEVRRRVRASRPL
jgi:hypothetical protein